MKTVTIPVVVRTQDNGDGGWSIYGYASEEAMLADHPLNERFDEKKNKFVKHTLTQKERDDILNEEDPNENGYISDEEIKLNIADDGTVTLAEPLSFHAGQ